MPDAPTPHALHLSLAEFARSAGFPLAPFQEPALELRKRITCVVAPRQSGKSRSLAMLALWWAFRNPRQRLLAVSAGELASQRLLAEMQMIAQSSSLLAGSITDGQQSLVTVSNGSRIKAVPASERQIRGETADLLLIDEAALVSDNVWVAAQPTVAAREHGKIVLASSAGPASGFFFDLVRIGEGHSDYVDTHYWELPVWVSATAYATAEATMSRQRLDAEFRNIFGGTSDNLLSREILDPCRADYLQDRIDSMLGPARVWTGHDWAMSGPDYTAMTAIGRLALRDKRVYAVRMTHRWPTVPMHQVVADIANSPAHYDAMNSETNGLGGPITEQLWRAIYNRPAGVGGGNPQRSGYVVVEERGDLGEAPPTPRPRRVRAEAFATTKRPIFMTAALKAHIFSALRLLLERHRLLIPSSAEDLYRELLQLKVDLTATGEKIEARSGHDDLAMSLALALYPYKDDNGAWRTRLSDYADPAVYPLPEPVLPAAMDRVELIPGPGDLMIPRTPAWVSVRGPELTLPPNLDLADPAMRDLQRRVQHAINPDQTGAMTHAR